MNKLTSFKKIFISISILLLFFIVASPASADISAYVNKDADGTTHYYYAKDDLIKSYSAKLVYGESSPDAALFNHYLDHFNTVAVLDDVTGNYVSFKELVAAYGESVIAKKSFNPNEYTKNPDAPTYDSIPTVIKKVVVKSGTTSFEDMTVDSGTFRVLSIE